MTIYNLGIYLIDSLIALMAPFLAWFTRNFFVGMHSYPNSFYFYALGSAVATISLLRVSGVSRVAWRFFSFPDTLDAFASISMGVIVGSVGTFFYDRLDSVPRSLPFIHILIQFTLYAGVRLLFRDLATAPLRRKPAYILLIGCNQVAYVYARAVEGIANGSLKIVAALAHDPSLIGRRMRGINIVSVFDNVEDVVGQLRIHGIELSRIVVAANEKEISPKALDKIFETANRHGLTVIDMHLLFSEVAGPLGPEEDIEIDEITLLGIYWGIKRAIDLLGAVVLLLLFSPFLVLTAIMVAIDVGSPLIFWQERPGRHGKMIRVYKFRTMKSAVGQDGLPVPDELRTSKTGLVIRKLRLDELPQLWNVLEGDMSFIGPRPLLFVDQPEEISQRLAARPGISGWAQVNGGKLLTPEEKRALDLWYIAHVSFVLEVRIIFLTLVTVFRGDVRQTEAIRSALEWLQAQEKAVSLNRV